MSPVCKRVSTRSRTSSSSRDSNKKSIKQTEKAGAKNASTPDALSPGSPSGEPWARWHDLRATIRQHTLLIAPTWSGDDLDPFLFLGFFLGARLCRQLQDARPLAGDETRQQHDAPIGEFQRIMMHMLLVLVDLAEARNA